MEIDCGDPDVKAVSDELDHPDYGDPWANDGGGEFVDGHEEVGDAVDEAYEANGDMPVSLNISAHGGPGGFKVGNDPTRGTGDGGGAQDLAGEIAGKVSSVTVFACETASGADGEALICELEQELGVDVTGYTGTVSYDDDGNWSTTGEAYSWEKGERVQGNLRRPDVEAEASIPLSWLTDESMPVLLTRFMHDIGRLGPGTDSVWDVNHDRVVDFFDLSVLMSVR